MPYEESEVNKLWKTTKTKLEAKAMKEKNEWL